MMETRNHVTSYVKWTFLLAGMVTAFFIYLLYSNAYGSNRSFDSMAPYTSVVIENPSPVSIPVNTEYSGGNAPVYIGIEIIPLDDVIIENLQLKTKIGIFINNVISGSPADKAGLKRGDVIINYDNREVEGIDDFRELIKDSEPGDTVRIVYIRNGARDSTYLELIEPPSIVRTANTSGMAAGETRGWGVSLSDLTNQLRDAFNIPDNINGIAILSVTPGSTMDLAGLKAGDIITGIGQEEVYDMSGFLRAASQDEDGIVLLDVYSGGRARYVGIDSGGIKAAEDI